MPPNSHESPHTSFLLGPFSFKAPRAGGGGEAPPVGWWWWRSGLGSLVTPAKAPFTLQEVATRKMSSEEV